MVVGARGPGGELAAAAVGRFGAEAVQVLRVATAARHRRKGLGRRLVRDLVDRGRRRGLERAEIEVGADNEPAAALYRSEGFVVVGRRRGCYRDGEDLLLLTAVLRRGESPGRDSR
jgi:ribosomal-protein-alanine N-acetyltransferase